MAEAAKKENVSDIGGKTSDESDKIAQHIVKEQDSNELYFAVVGPVGSGTSVVAETLKIELEKREPGYTASIIKASDQIKNWAEGNSFQINNSDNYEKSKSYQDAGDKMRSQLGDNAAVAIGLIKSIRLKRAEETGQNPENSEPIIPDGKKRAYILDSLKHPAEVALLRMFYKEAFCIIGVVCEEEIRQKRLSEGKFKSTSLTNIENFMKRDERANEKNGQQVSKTFHLADFFCDNSTPKLDEDKKDNPDWDIPEKIGRLVDAITHKEIVRPHSHEVGMYNAFSAKLRSSCLSRQVGASLLDYEGNLIAVGANEVPKAGGGTYENGFSELFSGKKSDHRCATLGKGCQNTITQNEIIDDIIDTIEELKNTTDRDKLIKQLKESRIGQLIEFSRAIHAEMDALLSAARQGSSIIGTRMYVTTYPCHNCARHIVTSGVDEVQFIEPYLKSKALILHGDAITNEEKNWIAPSQMTREKQDKIKKDKNIPNSKAHPRVLFRPFTGIAPPLYKRVFLKDRDLKDDQSGCMKIGQSDASIRTISLKETYAGLEARLTRADT